MSDTALQCQRLGSEGKRERCQLLPFASALAKYDRSHAALGTANLFSPPRLFLVIVILTQRLIRLYTDEPVAKSICVLEFDTRVKCIVLNISNFVLFDTNSGTCVNSNCVEFYLCAGRKRIFMYLTESLSTCASLRQRQR